MTTVTLKCASFTTFQVILLSATMPEEVLEVTKKFMRDPIRILVKKEELTLDGNVSLISKIIIYM